MKKVRNFSLVTYEESETISTEYLKAWVEANYEKGSVSGYCTIKHDKDVNEDGTQKKVHNHWVISFTNPRSWETVLTDLGYTNDGKRRFTSQFCEPCGYSGKDKSDNFNNGRDDCIVYMTHEKQPEKAQYLRQDILSFGIDIGRVFETRTKKVQASQEEQLAFIYDFIMETPRLDILELMEFAKQNGMLTIVASRFYMFDKLLKANRNRFIGWQLEQEFPDD